VIDGDTIVVTFKVWPDVTLEKTIRFLDIDTWEMRGPNKSKGIAAKEFLIKMMAGKVVILKTKGKTGKYGRTLGTIHVKDGDAELSAAAELKKNGHEKGE